MIKAEDLIRAKRLIPDVGVWLQCYFMWMAVAVKEEPRRTHELLSYAFLIVKCSKSFQWPAWVLYDQEFRQSRAGDQSRRWDEIDSCLYTQMFSGKAEEGESWCSLCHTTEHTRKACPFQPSFKRSQREHGPISQNQMARAQPRASQICHKFNRFNGNCRRGPDCPYKHACNRCGGPTPYLGARRELEWEARRMHRREQSRLEHWRKSPHVYCSVSQDYHVVLSDSDNRGRLNRRDRTADRGGIS